MAEAMSPNEFEAIPGLPGLPPLIHPGQLSQNTGAFSFEAAAEALELFDSETQELYSGLPSPYPSSASHTSYSSAESVGDSPPPSRAGGPVKKTKEKMVVHNAVERRYRNSINDRILDLDAIVPPLDDKKKACLS